MPAVISFFLRPGGDRDRAEAILDALGPDRPSPGNSATHWTLLADDERADFITRIERRLDASATARDWRQHLEIAPTDMERSAR